MEIPNLLWITLADPVPATNGQLIYSDGLIGSTWTAGANLCVLGLSRPERSTPSDNGPGLTWLLAAEVRRPLWRRLLSRLPEVALRGSSPAILAMLEQALHERDWDAIVVDSISAGWALDPVLRHLARSCTPPLLVHLAHNHEVAVARRIADAARGLRRLRQELDAFKVARLERRLVANADVLTANTPQDCRVFRAARGSAVGFLPPGYGGPRVQSRIIDSSVPRRAVIVGSFDWPPKRISLESFLEAGASLLSDAGVELQIVGEAQPGYVASLRQWYPAVKFVGRVDDVRPFMAGARLALVPDQLGGFKLKGLDYVFNRIPILSMRIALPGMPLTDGRSIGLFDSHRALAQGVVALIDDLPELNRRQSAAYDACATRFDWERIGVHLLGLLAHARGSAATVPAGAAASATGSAPVPAAAGR